MEIIPSGRACGAEIAGVDLSRLSDASVADIRSAWVEHEVVFFRDQQLDIPALERFTQAFGDFGVEPYVKTMDRHQHVIEVRREPSEKAAPFGSGWHSDWSFQSAPPAATILMAREVPPVGGDTWYASGSAAYAALEPALQRKLVGLTTCHSARRPYSHEGYKATRGDERSMTILPNDNAYAEQHHPLLRQHPETGKTVLWINAVYTLSIDGLPEQEGQALLEQLLAHCVRDDFVYKHRWQEGMLTMWDNRSVAHVAHGGYDGHRRVMHRTTVAGEQPVAAPNSQD